MFPLQKPPHCPLYLDAGLFIVFVIILSSYVRRRRAQTPYPPGPRAYPLIGNLFDLPKDHDWIHWAKHKDLYGPISHVQVLGKHIILLNEVDVAVDLMERQSGVYSDRPQLVFCAEMVGWKGSVALMNVGPTFRQLRRNLHQVIGTKPLVSRFNPVITKEARRFVQRMVVSPEKLYGHIRTTAGAIVLSISHGYSIEQDPLGKKLDPLVVLAEDAIRVFSLAAESGKWMVDLLPFLQHFPTRIYEPSFIKTAREWRKVVHDLLELPHAFVKYKMAIGDFAPSVTSKLLQLNPNDEEEKILKWSANALYAAGSDTTVAALHVFFLAMTLYPEVQRKAQEELDSVVGNDRLPTMEDRDALPYIDAVVKETFRWFPVVPMGFPHVASEARTYRGYLIPKGALLIPNIWLYTRDVSNYHDPEEFKPERFLSSKPEMDPRNLIFGFGRRICPGMVLADSSLFIEIATTLAAFNIEKVRNAQGEVCEPRVEFNSGVISQLQEFPCQVTPRCAKTLALVNAEEDLVAPVSDSEVLRKLQGSMSSSV